MTTPICNPALGTVLKYGTFSGTWAYTEIGLVESLDGPSREMGTRETTHLTTTTGKTFAATLMDNGEVSGSVQYDPKSTVHAAMEAIFVAKANINFQILLVDTGATTITFNGVLTKWGAISGVGVEDNLMADFSIKVSGDITIA